LKTSAFIVVAALAVLSSACNGSLYSPSHGPRLEATSFLAFGDSMTEGADPNTPCPSGAARLTLSQLMLSLPALVGAGQDYPAVLQQLLRDKYTAQQTTVTNRGSGGEVMSEGAARLPGALLQVAPQVTLILEGANDVNLGTSLAQVSASLATMIQAARGRGPVFVATVPAQRANGVNGACRGFNPPGVAPLDEQIRSTVRTGGAVLVDIYDLFGGVPDPYIGKDGLHPTVEGYSRIAQAFFTAITARLQD
jgi:lysophospholipase L1-like esterase